MGRNVAPRGDAASRSAETEVEFLLLVTKVLQFFGISISHFAFEIIFRDRLDYHCSGL